MRLSWKRSVGKPRSPNKHRKEAEDETNNLTLPESLGRAVELSNQKGLSNWLTSLPLECHGFFISQRGISRCPLLEVWMHP